MPSKNSHAMPLVFRSLIAAGERLTRLRRQHSDERGFNPEIIALVTEEIEHARLGLKQAEDALARIVEIRGEDGSA